MKIAFIGQKGIPARSGGVEKHVEGLAVSLAQRGHNVIVYSRKHYAIDKIKEYHGIRVITVPSIPTKNLDAISHTFFSIIDVIRRDIDVVHFHSIGPSSLLWLVKLLKPRAKVIATFHSQDYYNQKWNLFARLYLKFGEWVACTQADEVIVISKLLAQYVRQSYNTEPSYIPNGVAVKKANSSNALAEWNLTEKNYILAVARLIPLKGLHHLIKVYSKLETDKKLVIVGDGSYTDKYVQELKSLATNNPQICFTGQQNGETLAQLFENALLFIQSSESEGLSVALLEAMAHRLPVLVSDIPGNLEAIGDTGYTFRCNDVANLRQQLEYLLRASPMNLVEKGELARKRVETEYNWNTITQLTEKLYQEQLLQATTKKMKKYNLLTRFSTFI